MNSGWIDKQTGETAAQLLTRLGTLSDHFSTDCSSGSTIAYSANGVVLRQKEDEEVKECRGLTEAAAKLLLELQTDSTTSTLYYKAIGNNGEYAVVSILTGSKTIVRARRMNEAHGWSVSISSMTYSAASADGWSTTRPAVATNTGIVTDYRKTAERLYACASGSSTAVVNNPSDGVCWGIGTSVAALYQNCEQTTRVFSFLTQSEAVTKLENYNTQNNASVITLRWSFSNSTFYVPAKNYTAYSATAEYVDAERGWQVTVIQKVYSYGVLYSKSSSSDTQYVWQKYNSSTEAWEQISATTYPPFICTSVAWYNTTSFKIWEEE